MILRIYNNEMSYFCHECQKSHATELCCEQVALFILVEDIEGYAIHYDKRRPVHKDFNRIKEFLEEVF